MEVAALEASLVALANSSGDRENASSQRLEVQISVTTRAAKKHHKKPHCDGDELFELRRLLLNLCSRFLSKSFHILNHPYLKAHLDCYRKKNPVDKLADAGDLLQPVVVTGSGHLEVGE